MKQPKVKGTIAEFYILCELLKRDFIVSCVQGDYSGYDLIADWKGHLSRIQVKSTTVKETKWGYHITVGRGNSSKTKYTQLDCDFVLCVIPDKLVYVIPIREITSISLRINPKSIISKWVKYQNAWELLR